MGTALFKSRQELNQIGQDCVKLDTAPKALLANHCALEPGSCADETLSFDQICMLWARDYT